MCYNESKYAFRVVSLQRSKEIALNAKTPLAKGF